VPCLMTSVLPYGALFVPFAKSRGTSIEGNNWESSKKRDPRKKVVTGAALIHNAQRT
ncbi:hypothetical protein JRQ81_016942, partial [Phrynocephalus forsythii]